MDNIQVDFMLGSYMDDMGINADQFEEACAKGKAGIKTQFQQMLFEQVGHINFSRSFEYCAGLLYTAWNCTVQIALAG